MQQTGFSNSQMREMEGRLSCHERILDLAKQNAMSRVDLDLPQEVLDLDSNQSPAVELEQSLQGQLELRWSGYFRRSDEQGAPRLFALIQIDDEQLKELVGEEFFLFEDQQAEE